MLCRATTPRKQGDGCHLQTFSATARRKHREGRHLQTQMAQNIVRWARRRATTPVQYRSSLLRRMSRTLPTTRLPLTNAVYRHGAKHTAFGMTTCWEHCKSRHFRANFRGRSTVQRDDADNTVRIGSSLPRRVSRTLHAPFLRRDAGNAVRVVTSAQNFDAPHASAIFRGETPATL